jgi:hypothetical protein
MTKRTYEWWTARARSPEMSEINSSCKHCGAVIRQTHVIKQCPECKVVLHSACYDDTEGGQAYQTAGCESCRHRCYWR